MHAVSCGLPGPLLLATPQIPPVSRASAGALRPAHKRSTAGHLRCSQPPWRPFSCGRGAETRRWRLAWPRGFPSVCLRSRNLSRGQTEREQTLERPLAGRPPWPRGWRGWPELAAQTTHLNSSIKACRNVRKLLCRLMLVSSSKAMFPKT